MKRWSAFVVALGIALCASVSAQHGAEQRDMALVGHDDLQARSAYQPAIHHQGDRWVAYIGHHGGIKRNPITGKDEQNGTSIVDVTDPKKPRKQRKTKEPLQIADLELNKETVADLTEAQAERVKGGIRAGGGGDTERPICTPLCP